jgi:anti-sigma factor RsiW
MTCDVYEDLAAAHVDGVLSPDEQQDVETHSATCARCRQLFTDQSRFHSQFSAQRLIVPVPAAAEQRLRIALAAEQTPPSSRWERFSAFFSPVRFAVGFAVAGLLATVLVSRLFFSALPQNELMRAVEYYQATTAGRIALEYPIDEPQALAAALNRSGRLDFVTHVLDMRLRGYHIAGGHIVHTSGSPLALVLYNQEGGQHILCVRQRGTIPPMPAEGRTTLKGYTYIHAGYQLRLFQKSDHFCILISPLRQAASLRPEAATVTVSQRKQG